jgi:hypothetical protein
MSARGRRQTLGWGPPCGYDSRLQGGKLGRCWGGSGSGGGRSSVACYVGLQPPVACIVHLVLQRLSAGPALARARGWGAEEASYLRSSRALCAAAAARRRHPLSTPHHPTPPTTAGNPTQEQHTVDLSAQRRGALPARAAASAGDPLAHAGATCLALPPSSMAGAAARGSGASRPRAARSSEPLAARGPAPPACRR